MAIKSFASSGQAVGVQGVTVIVAPMTTKGQPYPTRVLCEFQGKEGQVVLDQIRTVAKSRLVQRMGRASKSAQEKVLLTLGEMFAK